MYDMEKMRPAKQTQQSYNKDAKAAIRRKNKEQRKLRKIERRHEFRDELTPEMKTEVFQKYGKTCYLCGKSGANTVDHVIPVIKGGTHKMKNLRPAHERCNKEKGHKIVVLPEELEGVGW